MAEALPSLDLSREPLENLMTRYQAADEEAAVELIRRLSPALLRFLSGPMQSREYAEDLLQDCWLRIHKSRQTYRPGNPVLPWIFAIARHTRVDGFRRRSRIDSRELAIEDLAELASPAAPRGAVPDQDLHRLLEELPESQREVILMLKVSGMSLEEVARATSSTVGAIKQKAHRAYEKLRARLKQL